MIDYYAHEPVSTDSNPAPSVAMSDYELVTLHHSGDDKCKKIVEELLYKRYERYLKNVSLKFFRKRSDFSRSIEYGEILSEVSIGFIEGVRLFDVNNKKKIALTTYCYSWMLQKVTRLYERESSTIRLPANVISAMHSKKDDRDEEVIARGEKLGNSSSLDYLDLDPEAQDNSAFDNLSRKILREKIILSLEGFSRCQLKKATRKDRQLSKELGFTSCDCGECDKLYESTEDLLQRLRESLKRNGLNAENFEDFL